MHKPLNDIRDKISQADSRLDKFLNPIETQYEKLKDKYVPDYARELMQLDNIPSEDLSSGDLTDVSQEYLDQAKGTIEADLDQKATEHVNDNIQTIDKELADAEKQLNDVGEGVNGVGERCKSRDGRRGECKINSGDVERDCGENMEFVTGRCPGPNKVQCCIPEPTVTTTVRGVGERCKSRDGRRGECKINSGDVERDCGENMEFVTGRCPGPNKVQCCIPEPTVTTTVRGVGERCKSRDGRRGECKINSGDVERDCGENMEFVTGRCPGPNKVQCCIPEPCTRCWREMQLLYAVLARDAKSNAAYRWSRWSPEASVRSTLEMSSVIVVRIWSSLPGDALAQTRSNAAYRSPLLQLLYAVLARDAVAAMVAEASVRSTLEMSSVIVVRIWSSLPGDALAQARSNAVSMLTLIRCMILRGPSIGSMKMWQKKYADVWLASRLFNFSESAWLMLKQN